MARSEGRLVWPCTLEKVYETVILEPLANPDIIRGMKDVKDVKILQDEVDEDGFHHIKLDILSDANLPSALHGLIKPHMMGWMQYGKWHLETGEYLVHVTPHFFQGAVNVKSHATHKVVTAPKEEVHTFFLVEAKVSIPLLGPIFEKVITTKVLDSLLSQFQKDIADMSK